MSKKIQVIQLVLSNGSIARFTGDVQIPEGDQQPSIDLVTIFEIDEPQQTIADAICTTENVLKKISEDRLNDEQRKHMLNNALELLTKNLKRG